MGCRQPWTASTRGPLPVPQDQRPHFTSEAAVAWRALCIPFTQDFVRLGPRCVHTGQGVGHRDKSLGLTDHSLQWLAWLGQLPCLE